MAVSLFLVSSPPGLRGVNGWGGGGGGRGVSEHLVVSGVSVGSSVCVWFDDPLVSVDSVEVSLYVCGLKIH